ncbi:MAG: M15 family metallopeptidase [Colwellia sp.]|nr:M15 family metallopeptidase [Colwellia sp.]
MDYKLSRTSHARLKGVNDKLIELLQSAISKSPMDFGIPRDGGMRTAKEQYQLYLDGVSKCDGTNNKSYHQSGNAFDIYAWHNGKASWDRVHLTLIAGVILSEAKAMGLNIKWGGTFGSKTFHGWDCGHFEIEK